MLCQYDQAIQPAVESAHSNTVRLTVRPVPPMLWVQGGRLYEFEEDMNMINPREVGMRLNALRQERGMSQQAIAALMNVTHQAVSKWETGAALPDIQTLLALSKLYRVSMEELLMGHITRPAPMSTMREKRENKSSEAPFLVPETEGEPVEKQDKPAPEDLPVFDLDEMAGLLPFLQTETIDAMMIRAVNTLQSEQLAMLAPFASSKALSAAMQDQSVSQNIDMLAGLLPFLRTDAIDERLKEAIEDEREDEAAMMAPFASAKTLIDSFNRMSDGKNYQMKMILAPFLPRGYLDQLFAGKAWTGKSIKESDNTASQATHGVRSAINSRPGFYMRRDEEMETDILGRAARALRERDDEWLDERAGELTAQELYELCRDAGEGVGTAMLLEHADKTALRGLLQLAAKEERWELVSLAADALK